MTPLDIFSLASGATAVARHYLPPLPERHACDTNAAYVPKPPPAVVTKPASPPPFPTGRSECDLCNQLRAIGALGQDRP